MGVGIDKIKPPSNHPMREGHGKPHNLILTRLQNLESVHFTTFFDYGCPCCYISSSLACKLKPYNSSLTFTMSGIGGQGPTITHDVLVTAQFCLSFTSNNWSLPFTVSVGIVPDGTFPVD